VQEKDKIIERKVHRDQELITGLITDRWAWPFFPKESPAA
jgi:hypothetical protein